MVAKELRITGKVHDAEYWLFLLSEAEQLPLEHFTARNIVTDGKECVLVRVDGPEELVSQFVAFAESQYPPQAVVDSVVVRSYADTVMSIDAFRQSFMVTQLAKLAQTGVSMLGKQDAMLGKQDRTIDILESVKSDTAMMLGKQDRTIDILESVKSDTAMMLEKQDRTIDILESVKSDTAMMLEKQDRTIAVLKEEGEKTRTVVKEEGDKTRGVLKGTLQEEIAWVKDELIDMKATLNRVKQKVGVE